MKSTKMLNYENVKFLCGLIRDVRNIDHLLNDLAISSTQTFSSLKITELAQDVKHELEQYVQSSINGLTHLKKKIVDVLPSDVDAEENILYLVKDTSVVDDVVYNQYLLIDGVLEPLGSTNTDLSNIYLKSEIDSKFALLSNLQTLIDMVGNVSDLETTAKDTLVNAINELKGLLIFDDEMSDTSENGIKNKVVKKYIDDKQVTKTWAEYQALSEAEKNNGTVYYIPDMPVSTGGEAIGEVERLNGYLASDTTVSFGDVIPFIADGNSNMTIANGLVTLKKGKTYNIQCDLRCGFSTSTFTNAILNVKDTNGNVYGKGIIDIKNGETGYLSGGHTSYSYSLTPSNDTTIGVYVTSNTNSIIIMSGASKLTITEIPSLQACIDVTDGHIKEVANEWKLFKSVTGVTEIDISSLLDKNELLIEAISNHETYKLDYTAIVLPRTLKSTNSIRNFGHYISSTDYSACKFCVNTSTARLLKSLASGKDITSTYTVNLYYR